MRITRRAAAVCAASLAALGLWVSAPPVPASETEPYVVADATVGLPFSRSGEGMINSRDPIGWAWSRSATSEHLAREMLVAAQTAEDQAYAGLLNGTYSPDVRYTQGTTDVAAQLAKKIVAAGYKKMTVQTATSFLNARATDFEHEMAAEHLPANSITAACGYWIDSMYIVGHDAHPTEADREQFRATCAFEIGKIEKEQPLMTGKQLSNDQRYAIGQTLAMLGGTFRTLASDPSEKADAVSGARAMFKSSFGYSLDDVPASRFPCVLSENKMTDCDTIMSRFGARLPEIARRNT
jgi:hypothetical protein